MVSLEGRSNMDFRHRISLTNGTSSPKFTNDFSKFFTQTKEMKITNQIKTIVVTKSDGEVVNLSFRDNKDQKISSTNIQERQGK